MFSLKEKTYEHSSEKIVDYLIGIFLLVLSVLPLLFTQIGDAIFSFLTGIAIRSGISDGRDALGFAVIVMIIVFGLPIIVGILTYFIARQRKFIFRGFLLATPILLIVWLAISGYQKDQEIAKLHYQIDALKKQQKTQTNDSAIDTSGWKAYTDKNGYQISYPNDFYFQDVRQIFAESRDEASKAGGAGGAPLPDDRIMFSTDSSDFATKAKENTYVFYVDTYSGLGTGDFLGIPTDNSFSTRKIGGILWKTKTYSDGTLALNVNKDSILYYISIPGKTTKDPEQMKKVNAMLNSFKFTNTSVDDQIFAEVSSQLGFTRNQVSYFRIHKQKDRVQYSFGHGTNFSYKQNNKWSLSGKANSETEATCSDLNNVPEQYRQACGDPTTGQEKYINDQRQSVNYLMTDMTSYIGE